MPAFIRLPSIVPDWTMSNVDKPEEILEGQFPPENEKLSQTENWVTTDILSRRKPRQQWTGGNLDKFTFNALLFSETIIDDLTSVVDKQMKQLTKWKEVDVEKGRPAVILYKVGDFEFIGKIDSLDFAIGDRHWTGAIKRCTATITLTEVDDTPSGPVLIDPTKPPHLSLYHTVAEGETYETIARAEYEDPIVGVFLRQDHQRAFPEPGSVVFLPRKDYFTRRPIAADAYALSEAPDAIAARRTLFAARGVPTNAPQVK